MSSINAKSYNRIPKMLPFLPFALAVAVATALATSPLIVALIDYAMETVKPTLKLFRLESLQPDPVIITIVWLIIAAAIAVDVSISRYRNFHNGTWLGEKPATSSLHGRERLESRSYRLRQRFTVWKKGKKPKPGVVVGGIGSDRNRLLTVTPTHMFLLGGTGSGKTTSVLTPTQVNLILSGCSCITTDPKGEEWSLTAALSAAQDGRKTICLDFSAPHLSDGWLPLEPAIDCAKELRGRRREEMASELRILADCLIPTKAESSPLWSQSARILFCGIAAFVIESDKVPEECKNLSTVAALASMSQEKMQEIVAKLPNNSQAKQKLEMVVNSPEETYGGFVANLNSYLDVYSDPYTSGMLSHSDVRAEDFLDGPAQIYIRFSSSSAALDALITAFLTQMIGGLRRLAETKCGGTLPIPLYLLLEEFPQLPKLPNLDKDLAVIRSQGIHAVIVAQDRSQIKQTYREASGAVFAAMDTTLFCSSNDLDTTLFYEKELGSYTVEVKSTTNTSNPVSGSTSENTSLRESPLFRHEHLRRWNYEIGHLFMAKDGTYACSSLPTSKTFVGDILGFEGKEPNAQKLSSMAPERPVKNPLPAPIWRWRRDEEGSTSTEIAASIASIDAALSDPRFT